MQMAMHVCHVAASLFIQTPKKVGGAYLLQADAVDCVHEHFGSHHKLPLRLQHRDEPIAVHMLRKHLLQDQAVCILVAQMHREIMWGFSSPTTGDQHNHCLRVVHHAH